MIIDFPMINFSSINFGAQQILMNLSRTNSDVNLYSPFLLKFQGRVAQISRKGVLTTQLHSNLNLQREAKKVRSTILTEKRAENILLDLNQIKSKNAKDLEHITHRYEYFRPHKEHRLNTVIQNFNSSQLGKSVVVDGSLSSDFTAMLRELDNLQLKRSK